MNEKKELRRGFAKLRRILFLRALCLTALATAAVLLLRELARGHLANWLVHWIGVLFSMNREQALQFYYNRIRSPNLDYCIGVIILLFMALLFWLQLRSFQSYFMQIARGIDRIVDGQGPISLPPELEFVEHKLNLAKQALQRREAESRLQEQQKNDMIVYLAHDIRTPLTSVIGYLSLLDENRALPEQARRKYLHIVREKANRLEQMVCEFFELTRYHLQAVPLAKTQSNLCYLLVQLSDELYPLLQKTGKAVELQVDEGITLWGDAEKLARAFNNLLKNAVAYGAPGGAIRVSASEDAAFLHLVFQNPGSIPASQLEKIFEKFYRTDPARASDTGGAGLGLAIARDIIRLHGGELRAESDAETTRFLVTLPRGRP